MSTLRDRDVAQKLASPRRDGDTSGSRLRPSKKMTPKAGFFQRRIQLKGGSSVSVPLGIVLLFPVLVMMLILLLFAKSHDADSVNTMPVAGTPPSIRFVPSRAVRGTLLMVQQEDKRQIRQAICYRLPRAPSQRTARERCTCGPREKSGPGRCYTISQVH